MSASNAKKVIIVCNNKDCVLRGAPALHLRLKEAIAQSQSAIEFDTYKCFGACDYGPNVVLYPQLELYSNLKPDDVPALLSRLHDGSIPTHLVADLDAESAEDVAESLEIIRDDYE